MRTLAAILVGFALIIGIAAVAYRSRRSPPVVAPPMKAAAQPQVQP